MIEQLFVQFGELVFQQTIGISIGMNCVPLLAVLFRHTYEAQFCQGLLKIKIEQNFNSIFRFIDCSVKT